MLCVHLVAFFSMFNIMGPLNATQCKTCGKKCFNVKASNATFILVQYRKGDDIYCPKQWQSWATKLCKLNRCIIIVQFIFVSLQMYKYNVSAIYGLAIAYQREGDHWLCNTC
jgi:hypothetical protein